MQNIIEVYVVNEDLQRRTPEDRRCPIERALDRMYQTTHKFQVGFQHVRSSIDPSKTSSHEIYELPTVARNFVRSFEHGETLEPINFSMVKIQ